MLIDRGKELRALGKRILETLEATFDWQVGSEGEDQSPGDKRYSKQEVGPGRPRMDRTRQEETFWGASVVNSVMCHPDSSSGRNEGLGVPAAGSLPTDRP